MSLQVKEKRQSLLTSSEIDTQKSSSSLYEKTTSVSKNHFEKQKKSSKNTVEETAFQQHICKSDFSFQKDEEIVKLHGSRKSMILSQDEEEKQRFSDSPTVAYPIGEEARLHPGSKGRFSAPKGFAIASDPKETFFSHQKILSEQNCLNVIKDKDVIHSSFYRRALTFTKKDLFIKENLFQFILLLNHPSPFVKYGFFNGKPDGECQILGLSECSCPYGSRNVDSKKKIFNVREKIEQRILEKAEKLLEEKKGEKLIYTSLGSGGCLQDFILLSKLILMGAIEIDIHMVDLQFQYENSEQLKKNFSEFFEQFPDVKFRVFFHSSFEAFSKEGIVSDLMLAIDWEENASKTNDEKIKILVSEKGFSYYNKKEPNWNNLAACQLKPLEKGKYY